MLAHLLPSVRFYIIHGVTLFATSHIDGVHCVSPCLHTVLNSDVRVYLDTRIRAHNLKTHTVCLSVDSNVYQNVRRTNERTSCIVLHLHSHWHSRTHTHAQPNIRRPFSVHCHGRRSLRVVCKIGKHTEIHIQIDLSNGKSATWKKRRKTKLWKSKLEDVDSIWKQ